MFFVKSLGMQNKAKAELSGMMQKEAQTIYVQGAGTTSQEYSRSFVITVTYVTVV